MSTNWDGVQYNIYSEYHDGGILQFASASAGILATLGVDVDDVSQQVCFLDNISASESLLTKSSATRTVDTASNWRAMGLLR
jgi:hypothetical protein